MWFAILLHLGVATSPRSSLVIIPTSVLFWRPAISFDISSLHSCPLQPTQASSIDHYRWMWSPCGVILITFTHLFHIFCIYIVFSFFSCAACIPYIHKPKHWNKITKHVSAEELAELRMEDFWMYSSLVSGFYLFFIVCGISKNGMFVALLWIYVNLCNLYSPWYFPWLRVNTC